MKTVILCGGMGTRLSEETTLRPKPMVTIGGRPILWHIMSSYASHGYNEFILALGYKGDLIKEYFLNYHTLNSDIEVDLSTGRIVTENARPRDWKVRMVDTGEGTMTGGRLRRLESVLKTHGTFMLTYGDGVCDVNIAELVKFHKSHGKLATVTAVRPTARFGGMAFDGKKVTTFKEKAQSGEGWINGGFFVMEPGVFNFLENDTTVLEQSPLEKLTQAGQLMAFQHPGYWQCMDTVRERQILEEQWTSNKAPWKTWSEN